MFKLMAPVLGVLLLILALETMPVVWAQSGHALSVQAPIELPASLTMIPFVGDILVKVQVWLPVIFQVVGAFSMIAAITANETDDKIVNYVLKAINFVGFNFGTAKNDPSVGVNKETVEQ